MNSRNFFNPRNLINNILLKNEIRQRIDLINREVQQFIDMNQGTPTPLYEAAYHLIQAGGKRIRSLITLLTCEAVGGDIESALPLAVAAELLQTASLIHDDIIDDDETRRGVPTVHRLFGKRMAILAGDLLISQAVKLLGDYGSPSLLSRMGSGGIKMCEGQATDIILNPETREYYSTAEYMKMVEGKTVAFFEEAARIGALVGGATDLQQEAIAQYARFLGFAFQIKDDIFDIDASESSVSKSTLSDIRLRRANFLLVHTLESLSEEEQLACLRDLTLGDYDLVLERVGKTDAMTYAMELSEDYVNMAKDAIIGLGFEKESILLEIADFVLSRDL